MSQYFNNSAAQTYHREGFFSPVRVITEDQASRYRKLLENYEGQLGHTVRGHERTKPHLILSWVDELMRHPVILDSVEKIIGSSILCWNSWFWIKEPNSRSFVSWHQDCNYWGLDTDELVTAWLALSPANEKSGCMRVLPQSHKKSALEHVDLYHEDNMLTRGQAIQDINERDAVSMPLDSGEMSLHNIRMAHASCANTTNDRRIGLSFHYIPTNAKQLNAEWDTATLVRGKDSYHHFEKSPSPQFDLDPKTLEFHQKATDAMRDPLFKGAQKIRKTI